MKFRQTKIYQNAQQLYQSASERVRDFTVRNFDDGAKRARDLGADLIEYCIKAVYVEMPKEKDEKGVPSHALTNAEVTFRAFKDLVYLFQFGEKYTARNPLLKRTVPARKGKIYRGRAMSPNEPAGEDALKRYLAGEFSDQIKAKLHAAATGARTRLMNVELEMDAPGEHANELAIYRP